MRAHEPVAGHVLTDQGTGFGEDRRDTERNEGEYPVHALGEAPEEVDGGRPGRSDPYQGIVERPALKERQRHVRPR